MERTDDMNVLDETATEFVAESREGLDQLERDLVELEARPDDTELLKRIFRVMHSLKGSAGFLGLAYLEELTHAGENLLSLLRDPSADVRGKAAQLAGERSVIGAIPSLRRMLEDSNM